ncbi:MAG: FHA domain-containing protein [Polyangiaceae bacterium]|nr:FHA domain-containing protein [Polyangiaceae bacterium]
MTRGARGARDAQPTTKQRLGNTSLPVAQFYWPGGFVEVRLPEGLELTIGRAASCDIVLEHPSVSRSHATLVTSPELRIADAGSANGTRVEGARLPPHQAAIIRSGMLVELGDVVFIPRTLEPGARLRRFGKLSHSRLREELDAMERVRIEEALEACHGNQSRAASLLGLPRRTFIARLERHGIGRPRTRQG